MPAKANRVLVLVVAFLAVLAGACADGHQWGSVRDAAGERQRVLCRGTTGPAIVFVHGIGDKASSSSFADVLDQLSADRRVCRYDRPGAGDSPPPSRQGRDAEQLGGELDSVVREADPERPVLVVGHSFGSYPVLLYTALHRDRVSGAILVDGVDPQLGLLNALGVSSWAKVHMAAEQLDLALVQEQTASAVARNTQGFADLPLTVIRRANSATPVWLDAQKRLAALSGKGRLVVAADSGHEIPHDNPAAVADAITHFQF